jgi:hypothetical protein
LLLYNGKRLHIHASMTTCIWLYVTDTPILSIFSSLGDESRNEQHSSTTVHPANDKTPIDLYFKIQDWLLTFFTFCIAMLRVMWKRFTWAMRQWLDHIC